MTEETNTRKNSMQEWWESDACKELQKAHQESLQKALGKYHMLSDADKCDMVQAICYILTDTEKYGTSHRGLMKSLGIYPEGFWIDGLMDVHNALWTYYQEEETQSFKNDVNTLKNFTETKKDPEE